MASSEVPTTERAQAWRNALFAGVFFGISFGLFTAWNHGWLPPASGGDVVAILTTVGVSGVVFGLLIGLFLRSPVVPKAEDVPLLAGETLEHSGLANHFLNFESRGGRLALTRDRLVFVPHAVNLQRGELSIPRSEIAGVAPVRILGVVPNGLAVTLRSGKVERFAVSGRDLWIEKIAAA